MVVSVHVVYACMVSITSASKFKASGWCPQEAGPVLFWPKNFTLRTTDAAHEGAAVSTGDTLTGWQIGPGDIDA